MVCPKCLSTSVTASNRFRRHRYHTPARSIVALLIDILGNIAVLRHRKMYGEKCVCMKCGHEWFTKQEAMRERYAQYTSKLFNGYSAMDYPGVGETCLQANMDGLVFYRAGKMAYTIPYDKIVAVSYQKNLGPLYGWLSVRDKAHKDKPFPQNHSEAKKDKTSIFYDFDYAYGYETFYSVLKEIVQENKKAGVI